MERLMRPLAMLSTLLVLGSATLSAAYISDYQYNKPTFYPQGQPYYDNGNNGYQYQNNGYQVQQNPQQNNGYNNQNCGPSGYNPCCPSFGKLLFSFDYIYWRACSDGQALALQQSVDCKLKEMSDGGKYQTGLEAYVYTEYDSCERGKFPCDNWTSGYRLGVSFEPACSCYDIGVQWLSYQPNHRKSLCAGKDKTLIPFPGWSIEDKLAKEFARYAYLWENEEFALFDFYVPFWADLNGEKVTAKWDLDLNLVDLEFGYDLSTNCCFQFRPHIGLRYASINQSYRVHTDGTITVYASNTPCSCNPADFCGDFASNKKFTSDFSGVGPRAGFASEIDLGCNLCLYGNFGASLVYGDRDSHVRESASRFNVPGSENVDLNGDNFASKRSNNRRCSSFISDLEVGLCWEKSCCYCYRQFDYKLKLGWEHHYFMNQSVVDSAKNDRCFREESADLSTQGLVVGFGFGF